jgi:hypothetical protein
MNIYAFVAARGTFKDSRGDRVDVTYTAALRITFK